MKYLASIAISLAIGILIYQHKIAVKKSVDEINLSAVLENVIVPSQPPFYESNYSATHKPTQRDSDGLIDYVLGCEMNCP